MAITRLYIVRHGESEWNRCGRIQGQTDVPLTDRGRRQAERLAGRLARAGVDALYASDLSRARETAEIIGRRLGLPVRLDPDWREQHYGLWQGLTRQEVRERYGEFLSQYEADPERTSVPGGESQGQLAGRVLGAALRLIENHAGGTVAVVSHGGAIRALLCRLLEMDLRVRGRIVQQNACLNLVAHEDGLWRVIRINDTCHLEDAEDV